MKRAAALAAIAITLAPTAHAFPVVGGQGLTPAAWALANYIQDRYPGVQSIGGVRADPLPDHHSGRAIDIMVGTNMALGDTIYADLSSSKAAHQISYLIWRQANHLNHIHVTTL